MNKKEIIVALSGSFDVVITNVDGSTEKLSLNRSYYVYLPAKLGGILKIFFYSPFSTTCF
jgi:hypothetical protein